MAQREGVFPWVPVCLGTGIGIYFWLTFEPSRTLLWSLFGMAAAVLVLAWCVRGRAIAPCLVGCALVLLGLPLAGWRTQDVAAPVLGWRYYGPVEGRVIGLDRSSSDAVRVTLDRVRMGRISPARTPERVRISLHGDAAALAPPTPGARVMTTAHVSPPSGPVEPGGFDFQRHAWFLRLGGVGYTRVPMLGAGPADAPDLSVRIFQVRMAISGFVRNALPGDVGGFGAAVTSGDRSGISQEALQDLRASNLAHLLAISGLHMGLLTGFVFAVLRFGLVIVPGIGLYAPARSVAAGGALAAGAVYLALSGGNVATERAFIMAAVALTAVMLNRRAISLRSVAIAALVVLVLRPEALLSPGFQMSFAATTALVAVFAAIRDAPWRLPAWAQPVSAVVISSGVAGLATAPFAAAHFNAFAHYGLLANVISVPVMGAIVVPAAVVAACLAPVGLAWVPLTVMGWGLWWILEVAAWTSALPGARSFVVAPSAWVLPCLTLGALFVILWRGPVRWIGVGPMLLAALLWSRAERPDLLIADTGALVGVMTPEGRALSKARGQGFVALTWLENDGDGGDQAQSHARWPAQDGRVRNTRLGSLTVWHITGKRAAAAPPDCTGGVLVSNADLPDPAPECTVFGPSQLRATGAIALSVRPDGTIDLVTARMLAGTRAWSAWPDDDRSQSDQYVRINPTNLP